MPSPVASVQLYTVREPLEEDFDATLDRLAALGVRNVEAFAFVGRARDYRDALDRAGLASPTAHAMLASDEVRFGDTAIAVPPVEESLAQAAELGVGLVVDPMVAPSRWADRDEVERTAERLNEASVLAASQGMRVGYHNHAHEFAPSVDGLSAYEFFVTRLDPAVELELDLYWAAVAGQDVPALVERLGARLTAVHVKDGPLGEGLLADDGMPRAERIEQVRAGQGDVPLAASLAAAASLRFAIVEFDAYAGDIFDGVARGLSFLAERGIR